MHRTFAGLVSALALAACATAPRQEIGAISDAGVKATATLQTEVVALSDQLQSGTMTEAFVQRWQVCQNPNPAICGMPIAVDQALAEKRRQLAIAVQLRAQALSALGAAYLSLKQEAEFDAGGAVRSATNAAVGKVNDFAGAIFALSGAPIPEPVLGLVGEAAGIFADQRQRARILAANAKVRDVTQRLHDALAQEAYVFDTVADVTETRRAEARIALAQAGLIGSADLIQPMVDSLGLTLNPGADQTIAASPVLRAAAADTARAGAAAQAAQVKGRYQTALAALASLIVQQDKVGTGTGLSLSEVDRLLGVIGASLPAGKPASPVPSPASSTQPQE